MIISGFLVPLSFKSRQWVGAEQLWARRAMAGHPLLQQLAGEGNTRRGWAPSLIIDNTDIESSAWQETIERNQQQS